MITKLSVSAAALAALGLAAPAMAENLYDDDVTVDIEVEVQQIATLEVEAATARMVIDDDNDNFMGNPTSGGNDFSNVASVKLATNFDVDSIRFSFDDIDGSVPGPQSNQQGNYNAAWTEAFGDAGSNTRAQGSLAVLPQGVLLDGPGGNMVGNTFFGAGAIDVTNSGAPFGNGVHYAGIGVSTNWGNTFDSQGLDFAEQDLYVAEFDATIVPSI